MNSESFETNTEVARNYKEKKVSLAILHILNDFVASDQNTIKRSTNTSDDFIDLLLHNRWLLIIIFFILGCILFASVLAKLKFPGFEMYLLGCLSILLFLLLGIVVYIYKKSFKYIKKIKIEAISTAKSYDLEPYDRIIEYLGETFYEENLKREEFRFKLAINQRKRRGDILVKATPLLAILLVVISIYILGFPSENNEITFLYGTIVGISGIVLLVKVILDVFLEWLNQDLNVYEKCILILQAAQHIAKEEELDALRAYDEAIASDDEVIPFEEAIAEIERNR